MDDHRPTSSGGAMHESTRDQVRRALEAAGILFVESDRGRGVMLLNEQSATLARGASHVRS